MSLVNISLVGNLARTPEQIYFASGRVKTTLVVAVNHPMHSSKGQDTADFYRVETWGKLAELANQYLAKGNQVAATGRLILDHWIDKTGKSRITPTVQATQLSLPPKLKVLQADEEASCHTNAGNSMDGQVIPSDEDPDYPLTEASCATSGSFCS